ncbi:IPT/TIG domain-containing protein [Paramaledivibacter caminithermalis]|uniref:IPT/TIG domain-containing protein n=1 Tax=Paramaledivibacter caminithermalis (strain DSM 15212 / CIP 107654 / DViRD3) TaxID=1121301 RepID=A0A1M6KFN6_PARC5|nr:IPT/TIG domain-containing protein [Paramaledivibacter caminithermalis]SHJ57791.1 IPT/TIG domain-containing protein [Paramaledivibacter caminithermalis DSM 15212]
MLRKYSKTLIFILTFLIIFTSISFENIVYADTKPEITMVELEAVNIEGKETTRYKIRGINFEEPEFLIDTYPITKDMYTRDNDGAYIVEKNADNSHWNIWLIPLEGKTTEVRAVNADTDGDNNNNTHAVDFKIEKLPHINSVSARKVYVGETLTIYGTGFDVDEIDGIYIAGVPYTKGYKQGSGTEADETLQEIIDDINNGVDPDPADGIAVNEYDYIVTKDGNIFIPYVKEPHASGNNDVQVIKDTGDKVVGDDRSVEGSVVGRYRDAVKVVKKVETIDIQKIVPNTGPVEGGTEVKIYENIDPNGESKLQPDMKLYVEQAIGQTIYSAELTDVKLISNGQGDVIGISGVTPKSPTGQQGVFDIVITDNTGSNEQRVHNAFTYEEKQNLLQLTGIEPIQAKPFQTVELSGANIINLNIPYLEEWNIVKDANNHDDAKYQNGKYIINYKGKYLVEKEDGSTELKEVDIIREIQLIIGQISEIIDEDILEHSPSKDKLKAIIPETNDYGVVTVTINTSTTVKDGSNIIDIIEEEAEIPNGFTIIPSNTKPVIQSIEPAKGDVNKKIYVTIKGKNFQVLADQNQNPIYPQITVGNNINDEDNRPLVVTGVFDDEKNVVNGIGREIGTIITGYIQGPTQGEIVRPGPVNVKIKNPDKGEVISYGIFEFLKPDTNHVPKITKIDPNMGPLEGRNIVTIEGEEFDYEKPIPEVLVTIGGQKARVIDASSTRIEVEVPPGLSIGEKAVQVITEDGAMDTIEVDDPNREGYTYVRKLGDPKVERIAPDYGGAGTIVYIFGKDKGIDNPNFFKPVIDPNARVEEMMGTRIFLNGIDINDMDVDTDDGSLYERENKNPDGTLGKIKDIDGDGSIYDISPQDTNPPQAFEVEISDINNVKKKILSRVEVIDGNTLRVLIPNGYTAGLKDITILNPDSSSVTIENGFDYKTVPIDADVAIESIQPNIGSNLGGDHITISGRGFKDGAEVFFGGYKAENVDVNSENKMIVKTPPYPLPNPDLESYKDVEVVVVNYDGSSASSPANYPNSGYRYMAPKTQPIISSIEPNTGTTLGNEIVTIYGKDFRKVTINEDGTPLEEKDYKYPSVYFGSKIAELLEYKHNKLIVRTPFYGKDGSVDVTVKNPQLEFGSVTKDDAFKYRTSNPKIISVFPDRAQKIGGDEITISGEEILPGEFGEGSDIKIQMIPENSTYEPKIEVLAIFGDEKDEDKLSFGEARNNLGSIIIDYNANRKADPFIIDDNNKITDSLIVFDQEKNKDNILAHYDLSPEERHIFVVDWKALEEEKGGEDSAEVDIAEEAIIVELIDDTLISRRRVAPRAEVKNKEDDSPIKTVVIQTPPSAIIGKKNLYIENKDRGWDQTSFEYIHPSSRPVIKEIIPRSEIESSQGDLLKYYVESTIEGGLYITIDGYDFRQGVEVFIDGTPASIVSRNVLNEEDEEGRPRTRLVVTAPKGEANKINEELKIMIINPDGGFVDASDTSKIIPESPDAEAKPYYFVYRIPESSPYIDSILPTQTSQYGGNRIRIIGYDFRTGVTVVIGGRPCSVISVDNDEIIIETPTDLTPGLKDVQVINADHGTVTKTSAISVISYPEITTITTEGGDDIHRVSIEGGEKIVLSGRNFQSGAVVYFGGERKEIGHSEDANVKGLFKDDNFYTIEGTFPSNQIEFISENKLIVTIPEVFEEGEYKVSVINPDGGLSDENNSLNYTVPIPTDPVGLRAEIVNEKYIRIYGYSSSNANYYEVYACIDEDYPDDEDFKYLDTTEKTSYKITKFKELDDDENIYLRIRAVNKYGPSEWSNIVKISYKELDDIDGIGEKDKDGDLVSDYQETVDKDKVNVILGNKNLRGSDYFVYVIDLKDKKYENINKRIINIPGKTIKKYNKVVLVDNGDTKLQFNTGNFNVYYFKNLSSKELEDTYGRIVFDKSNGRDYDYMERKLPRKYRLISKIYDIRTEFQTKEKTINLDSVSGYMNLEISYDENKLMGSDETKLGLYKFNPQNGEWIPLTGGVNPDTNKVHGTINGPGQYGVLGEK